MANRRPVSIVSGRLKQLVAADTLHAPGDAQIDGDLTVDGIITGSLEVTPLTADEDIYVDTAGNDTTGTGAIGAPYLTIHRAAEHYSQLNPGNQNIIVHINAGVHTVTEKFSVNYPYGGRLNWVGAAESISSPTISSIDATPTTGSAPYTGLEFVDFDLDLTGSGAAVGYFVRLTDCAGGTNPDGLNGLAEIVAWDGTNATCRMWRCVSTTEVPSGSITVATVFLIKSVLKFTADDHGIDLRGPTDVGAWDKIVIRGNDDAYTSSKRAVRLFNGAGMRADGNIDFGSFFAGVYIYEWGAGIEQVGSSSFYALRCGIAKIKDNATTIGSGSTCQLCTTGKSTINGVILRALWAHDNSELVASTVQIQSVGAPVRSDDGAYINITDSRLHYDQGAGTAIIADDLGRVLETGSTIVGFATDYSPAADTQGNNGSWIATL